MNKYSVPFWEITELPTGHFMAEATKGNKLCYPEERLYFNRQAAERDFGKFRGRPEEEKRRPEDTQTAENKS